MKILHIISSYPPAYSYGGPPIVAREMVKRLTSRGHSVSVITTDAYNKNERIKFSDNPSSMDGATIFRFRNISNSLSWLNYSIAPYFPIFLFHKLTDIDVIHLHEYRSFYSVITYYYSKKRGVPYILQSHGSAPIIIEKKRIKKLFDRIWGEKILCKASAIIALSSAEFNQLVDLGVDPLKIIIVPNGIDTTNYYNPPKKGAFKNKYNISNSTRVILFAGRLHKRKGIDFLIRTFYDLLKDTTDVVLVIAGPLSDYKKELDYLVNHLGIGGNVIFTGFIADLREAYVDADLLVYPSIYEIFGLVPFESIMCNTPIVVTDDCGCGDLVKDANCGYLVKYGDTDSLNKIIKNILRDPSEAQLRVKNGVAYIKEKLIWEKIIIDVEDIYKVHIKNF